MRLWIILLLGGLVLSSAACSSYYDLAYEPRPRVRQLTTAATVLVTIVGIRKADDEAGLGPAVEAAFRVDVDKDADQPITLKPESIALTTANLITLGPPTRTTVNQPITVPPGESQRLTVLFELPASKERRARLDLSGLNLRWTLEYEGNRVPQNVTFSRTRQTREAGPRFGVGLGLRMRR